MNNIILGKGQVANAIKSMLKEEPLMFDKGEWEDLKNIKCDIFHITIPYTDEFIDIVKDAQKIFQPDYVIMHSTVKPGTTTQIFNALYSPVMGRHADDFENNVKLYFKFFAGKKEIYDNICNEFKINNEYWGSNINELEYAKVMSTTRMYWDLVFIKYVEKDCKKMGMNYSQVVNRWTENYNRGIEQKHRDWTRPIYHKMETDLPEGHCLRPNIHLADNEITKFLKAYEKNILYYVTGKT